MKRRMDAAAQLSWSSPYAVTPSNVHSVRQLMVNRLGLIGNASWFCVVPSAWIARPSSSVMSMTTRRGKPVSASRSTTSREADASFDAVFCAFGVRNVSDLEAASREQLRVLRPGGRLTVLEFFRPRGLFSRAFHACYNNTVLPVVGWAATGNLGAYLYLPRSIGRFAEAADYCALLERVGFVHVRHEGLFGGVAGIVRAERPAGAS